ncbi:MAG: Gfo/Idh/MocA family oxidoreductase [Deltaproteobacteria bacterium]|nr:Gfo/Idh/MocA family oxidoreductase [Deltaproteobacteria bacterium]
MRFLIVGLGSMGKRRIRNLQYLKAGEIIAYDPRDDRCQEAKERYGIMTFPGFDEAMAADPDVMIISTPPDLHMPYARIAAMNGKHFFTEASVVDNEMDEVITLCSGKDIVGVPSCTMRFNSSVRVIRDLVCSGSVGSILAFTHHFGQYLPDWHPWEDYRSFYVAKRETGACREIVPFELVWLTWILGDVEKISCFKEKLSTLDLDIDDVYQVLLRFKHGALGSLLVDVISRVAYRSARFISETAVIEWVSSEKRVRVFQLEKGWWDEYHEPEAIEEKGYVATENPYIEEMKCFVQAIRDGGEYPYSFSEDKKILGLLYAAERSSADQVHVDTV